MRGVGRSRETVVDLADARIAGVLMLAAASARVLVPDAVVSAGLPCPLRTLTGIPCPLCGATTSVTATMELDVTEALAANPVGPLLVIAAVVLVVNRRRVSLALPGWVMPVALACLWVYQLGRAGLAAS